MVFLLKNQGEIWIFSEIFLVILTKYLSSKIIFPKNLRTVLAQLEELFFNSVLKDILANLVTVLFIRLFFL